MDEPTAVLFCCTNNAIRSPMAEAMMKQLHGHHIYVDSAGVRTMELDPMMIEVMAEKGIDMSRHNPKSFDDLQDGYYDVVVSLSPEAQHKAVEMTRTMACDLLFWNTLDPTLIEGTREQRLEAYRMVRDELLRRIKQAFPVHGGPTV
ncbi:MAG: arsenate reductase ArsC [Alphaproteobacteria bacterium]|nr:arsenate reductase ArsC [Alphaproteobacteria bacterium]